MLNANIKMQSTSSRGIKISRKRNFSAENFSMRLPKNASLAVAPWQFTTDHCFVNEPERLLSIIEDPLWKYACREI